MTPHVEVCSPEEAARLLKKLGHEPARWPEKLLKGYVDLTCREADGSVAWEVHQPNLITDYGRRRFLDGILHTFYVVTSPSADAPANGRSGIIDYGTSGTVVASQESTFVTPTYDAVTLTKTWNITFTAPAYNRALGCIGLTDVGSKPAFGVNGLIAYTLLSPVRTQTTSQTLEVLYRITINPVY